MTDMTDRAMALIADQAALNGVSIGAATVHFVELFSPDGHDPEGCPICDATQETTAP